MLIFSTFGLKLVYMNEKKGKMLWMEYLASDVILVRNVDYSLLNPNMLS